MPNTYTDDLIELWSWVTGETYLGPGRDSDQQHILRFKSPNIILAKYTQGHIERALRERGYDVEDLKNAAA